MLVFVVMIRCDINAKSEETTCLVPEAEHLWNYCQGREGCEAPALLHLRMVVPGVSTKRPVMPTEILVLKCSCLERQRALCGNRRRWEFAGREVVARSVQAATAGASQGRNLSSTKGTQENTTPSSSFPRSFIFPLHSSVLTCNTPHSTPQ